MQPPLVVVHFINLFRQTRVDSVDVIFTSPSHCAFHDLYLQLTVQVSWERGWHATLNSASNRQQTFEF